MYNFTLAKEFTYKGYNCFIVNSSGGWRNGYVEIPKDNLFFGKSFGDEVPIKKETIMGQSLGKRSPISMLCFATDNSENLQIDMLFNVHGGITYGDKDLKPVDKNNSWFIGFDCNHLGDGKDYSIMDERSLNFEKEFCSNFGNDVVRSEEYVEQELFSLVDQIIEFNNLYNNK
ncbi:MAG TPA: hypothetical protein PKN54_11075 [Candidatus Cloacimonas acidaminovorans]|nr:hypothetical protein [Candidatus Cloacimonas acidaminovorans]